MSLRVRSYALDATHVSHILNLKLLHASARTQRANLQPSRATVKGNPECCGLCRVIINRIKEVDTAGIKCQLPTN